MVATSLWKTASKYESQDIVTATLSSFSSVVRESSLAAGDCQAVVISRGYRKNPGAAATKVNTIVKKSCIASENGLGIQESYRNEINKKYFIQMDFTNLIKNPNITTDAALTITSVDFAPGEIFSLYGSYKIGEMGTHLLYTNGSNPSNIVTVRPIPGFLNYTYISVTAVTGDVLIGSLGISCAPKTASSKLVAPASPSISDEGPLSVGSSVGLSISVLILLLIIVFLIKRLVSKNVAAGNSKTSTLTLNEWYASQSDFNETALMNNPLNGDGMNNCLSEAGGVDLVTTGNDTSTMTTSKQLISLSNRSQYL